MIYAKTPWKGMNVVHLHKEILEVPLGFEEKKGLSESWKDLMRKMLVIDQDKRLTFEEIMKHEALKKEFLEEEKEDK